MDHVQLGATGTRVSEICLGTMGFGSPDWRPWVVEADEAVPIIERALELGVNFLDTADMYSQGRSEEIVGQAIDSHREDVVLATKVFHPMGEDAGRIGDPSAPETGIPSPGPNARGLGRKHIRQALADSLDRLGTDHVDLYQIHRYDHTTPIEETLATLDEIVREGKAHYLGASTMWAWQFARMLERQKANDWHRFATMQNHYNLLYREEEREMMPLCRQEGVGSIPWSPLARGELAHAGQQRDTTRAETGTRFYDAPGSEQILDRVAQLAEDEGVQPAQIALAWLLHKDGVTAPIVGVTSIEHLEAAVEATELDLSDKDLAWLEEPYQSQAVRGWIRGGGVPREHLHENEPEA
jgi:aryl-alcohol dehydrogenase-like predicted oxidoreductase